MSSASIWVKRDEREKWRLVAALAALAMLAAGLITAFPLTATATSNGQVDDTAGVYLYNAGQDTQGFQTPPPADCAGADSFDPTNDTVQLAVDAGILYFIGDEPSEVIDNNLGADLERLGGTPDTTIGDVNLGLSEIDDYGLVDNGGGGSSDDDENYDAQTGGDITLQLDVDGDFAAPGGTDIRYIVPDGVTSVGVLEDIPGQEFQNLDGAEIFIFEDAETSGMTIELFGPGGAGPYVIDIVDYQRNPDTVAAADDTLIAIDLDSLPGFTFPYVESIKITDDNIAISPNVSSCPGGSIIDTSLELDAVATRTDTVVAPSAIDIEKATNGIDADVPTGPSVPVGSTVTWTYVVTNSGQAPLVNMVVTDSEGVDTNCAAADLAGPLAPGASFTCTATGPATAGQYANDSDVVGTPLDSGGDPVAFTVTDEDPSHYLGLAPAVDIEKTTNGVDSDTAPGADIPFGDPVVWTYVVLNTGTSDLVNLTVTDNQGVTVSCEGGGATIAGPIAPGDTFTCTGTGTAGLGLYTNVSDVVATPVDADGVPLPGGTVTDEDPSNYTGVVDAAIDIEKATNGQDADTPTGPGIAVGEPVTWTYVVENTGTTNLINAAVTDSVIPDTAIDCGGGSNVIAGVMAPGDIVTCTATGPATLGQYTNTGFVAADPADAAGTAIPGVNPVVDEDDSHYIGTADAAIDIEKATDGIDADTPTGPEIVVGDTVTWTYVVTNTGTTALVNMVVTDSEGVNTNCAAADLAGPLAPGGSFTCTATGTATAGQYMNDSDVVGTPATADGTPIPGLANVIDEDPSHYVGLVPSVNLEKSTNDLDADTPTGPAIPVGDAVTWTYTVTNDGDVTLTDVTVTDSLVAASDINCGNNSNVIATMAPGDVVDCFASGTATFGQYMNTGAVEGQPVNPAGDPIGDPVESTDPSHYIGTADPSVSIEKATNGIDADTPTGPELVVGETATWTYVVTNTGSTNLVDLTVTDSEGVTVSCDGGGATVAGPIAPNGTFTCTASGPATAGQYMNDSDVVGTPATADGTPIAGLADVVDDDPSHYIGLVPGITLEKATNGQDADNPVGPTVAVGDPVTWTYEVTNSGSTTLTGVTVTDNVIPAGDIDCDAGSNVIATMAPGDVVVCTASGIAELGQYANMGDVEGQPVNAAGDPVGGLVTDDDPSHYFGTGVPAVDIEKATNTIDADVPTGPTIPVTDAVAWTYVVTNTGDVPLVNFIVTDDQGVAVDCGGGLATVAGPIAPGDDFTCSGSGTAVAGQYANNSDVIADPVDGDGNPLVDPSGNPVASPTDEDPSHYFGADPSIDLIKRVNGNNAQTAPGVAVPVGSTVNWGFVVTNTGNVDLVNVAVNDPQVAGISCPGGGGATIALLAPGDSVICSASGIAAAGQVTNIADVEGTPQGPDGTTLPPVVDDDPANYFGGDSAIDIEKDTDGTQADTGTGPVLVVGDPVIWTYVVTNIGTSTLDTVTVTDNLVAPADIDCGGGSNVIGTMVPGDVVNCTAEGVVTAGQYNNTGSVTGVPANGDDPVSDEDPSAYLGADPAIEIEKATNGEDADAPTGPSIMVGDTVTWTYVVTNNGNIDLGSVTVTDSEGVAVDCGGGSATLAAPLAPGDTVTCTATGPATAGQYMNDSDVTGVPLDENGAPVTDAAGDPIAPVVDEDPSHYFGVDPQIQLEKATNGIDADAPTGPILGLDDTVTWTYVVTNTGNVDLTNVTVTDDQGVTIDCGAGSNVIALMAPAAEVICTGVGSAELGQYANMGDVTGDPVDAAGNSVGGPVTDDDPSHYFGLADPNIELTKFVEGADANTAPGTSLVTGDAVTWTYVVTNTGNVDLATVTVTDDQGEAVDCGGGSGVIALLAVGDTVTCEAEGVVTAGQYTNLGEVTGAPVDANGDPVLDETGTPLPAVTDDDPANYFGGDSAIDVEKATNGEDADTPTGPSVLVGDAITWTYVVENTGNLDLSNVSVVDDQGVTVDCPSGNPIPLLAIGTSETCTGEGVAVDGQYENTVTATGTDTNGGVVTDEDLSHYIAVDPSMSLEKATNGVDADTPAGPSIAVGETVTWTYEVTNDGTATLTNVTVTDDIVPAGDIDCGDGTNVIATMAPTDVVTCTATGVATAGQYANLGSVDAIPVDGNGDPIGPALVAEDPSHYFGGEPGLTLEKATNGDDADVEPGPVVAPGDTVIWTYVVTNTGNVALTDVTVTDDQGVAIDCGDGTNVVATLAAGDSATCTGEGPAIAGQYENTGSVAGVDPDGNTLEASDPSHYFGAAPGIDIEKATNGTDADAAPGPSIQTGDPVTWTYVVINTGNVTLENVEVTDDQVAAADIDCGDGTNIVATLAPSAVANCTATGVAIDGAYTNTANAAGDPVLPNGDPVPGGPVSDDDPSNYTGTPEPLGNIGDTVWIDLNADGVIDNGEVGLPDVDVTLTDSSGNVVGTATTDANGQYLFTGLPADTYTVTVDTSTLPAGYSQTYDNDGGLDHTSTVTLAPGATDLDQDFGYVPEPSLDLEKDTNGFDGDTAPGITVQVGDVVTWTYKVTNDGPVVVTNIEVTDDQVAASEIDCGDGTNTIASLAPGDTVDCVATGVATAGAYTNTASAIGEGPTGAAVSDEDPSNYTGTTEPLGSIGDTVWLDENRDGNKQASEVGLGGVTVGLIDADGNIVATQETAADGTYLFTDVPAGTYTIAIDKGQGGIPAGAVRTYDNDGTLDNASTLTLPAGGQDLDQDFGYALEDGVIGDTIWLDLNADGVQDPDEVGIAGINVTLTDANGNQGTVATDGDGKYLFDGLPAGTYTVTVNKANTAISPGNAFQTYDSDGTLDNTSTVVLPAGGSDLDQDFGYVPAASIGNYIFEDTDGDGVQDPGEGGVEGAVVNLYTVDANNVASSAPVATVTTGPDGEYTFPNLDPRLNYAVQVVVPDGAVITTQDAGGDDARDSDIDPNTGFTTVITLAPGDNDFTFDAGIVPVQAGITINKLTNGDDADTGQGQNIAAGETITWTYVVTNTGGTTLANVTVNDDMEGAADCPKTILAPGESMTCSITGVAQAGLLYTNNGTVNATPAAPDGTPLPGVDPITDDDPSAYTGVEVINQTITPVPTATPTATPAPQPTTVVVVVQVTPTPDPKSVAILFAPNPVGDVPANPPLALTGRNSTDFALVATAFILAGAAFVVMSRRNREEEQLA